MLLNKMANVFQNPILQDDMIAEPLWLRAEALPSNVNMQELKWLNTNHANLVLRIY